MKKGIVYLLGMMMALAVVVIPEGVFAAEMNVESHTQSEIKQMYKSLNPDETQAVTYEEEPVTTAPYSAGKLSDAATENALNTLNFVRYIAGIPYDVEINETYQEKVQAGTLINCVNDRLTHDPAQPEGMDDGLYIIGKSGCSSSNIGWGYANLYKAIIDGWMEDGDNSNKDRVGHRRWCLNPSMKYTGFGKTGSYSAMYAFDTAGNKNYYGVAWPAQNMPIEMLPSDEEIMPWSISIGESVDIDSLTVALTRRGDGTKWNFSSTSADGYFNVNNDGYGQKGAIIFCPNNITSYNAGDVYDVSITGSDFNIEYTVKFFSLLNDCEHVWNKDYTVDQEATCTETGSESIHCSLCDTINEETVKSIPATGHSYGEWVVTKEATCTEDGSQAKTCSKCEDVVTESIAATGHKWEADYTVDKKATCTEDGSKSIHCSVCDAIKDGSEQTIPATGHDYGDWVVTKAATCTEEGSKSKTCSKCEDVVTESIAATGHKWEADYTVDQEATCTETGSESIHCSVCDAIKDGSEQTIPATGHSYGEWVVTKEATCTEDGSQAKTCSKCEDVVTESIAATGHSWNEDYTVDEEATCTEDGFKSIHCSVCDAINEETVKSIPATGHSFTNYVYNNDASCVNDGTETATCENGCGETDTRTVEGTALGHDFGDWTEIQSPSCVDEGSEQRVCTRCELIETRGVQASGHTWDDEYTIDCEATCTEDGSKSIHCRKCEAVKDSQVIPALGHDYVDHEAKEATCTEKGHKAYQTCSRCDYTTYEEIPATGHDYGDWVVTKEATCTEDGYKSIHCSVCDAIKEGSEQRIPATGHSYSDWVITKEATCTESGSKSRNCTECHDAEETAVIPALGHDIYTVTTSADTTEAGSIEDWCCRCEKRISYVEIPRVTSFKLSSSSYTYSGGVKTPAVTVKDAKGQVLKNGTDYTVSYASGRKNVGTYKVKITLEGNYWDVKSLYFKINPKGTSISKVTKAKKAFTVKWKKQSTQTSGYQILYSTSSKFKSGNKYVTVKSNKTTSKKITKLKAKKKYYVKVRTYKTVNGTKYYSGWSAAKTVKTK